MTSNILSTTIGVLVLAAAASLPGFAKSPHSISIAPIGSVSANSFLTSAAEIGVLRICEKGICDKTVFVGFNKILTGFNMPRIIS